MPTASARKLTLVLLITGLISLASWVISCGGGGIGNIFGGGGTITGVITTSLSDPPTCAASFDRIWVSVTKVQANTSASAGPNDPGWVTLADLSAAPQQVDLLSLASLTCTLTALGSASGVPVGNYQQVRLYLLDNKSLVGPTLNHCGNSASGFNCVVPRGGVPAILQVGSAAQTGIRIASSQINGGGINLTSGKSTNINITFDSCASILPLSNGQFRLKPVVRAGEVLTTNNFISGKVVDSVSSGVIPGAVVLLEQPDVNGIDRVTNAGVTAADGTFIFCPLASGNYDVVLNAQVAAAGLATTVYGTTVAFKVPAGTALNNVTLVSEGTAVLPPSATLAGQVTSSNAGAPTIADVTLSALQQALPVGSPSVLVTVPIFLVSGQPPTMTTLSSPFLGPSCASGTNCFNYSLVVPSGGPQVGTFSGGSIIYTPPTAGAATYSISGASSDCTASVPASGTVNSIPVSPGNTTQVSTPLIFTGCTAPL